MQLYQSCFSSLPLYPSPSQIAKSNETNVIKIQALSSKVRLPSMSPCSHLRSTWKPISRHPWSQVSQPLLMQVSQSWHGLDTKGSCPLMLSIQYLQLLPWLHPPTMWTVITTSSLLPPTPLHLLFLCIIVKFSWCLLLAYNVCQPNMLDFGILYEPKQKGVKDWILNNSFRARNSRWTERQGKQENL